MIDITPFSASTPYASLDAIDFETENDSISFGSSELNLILLIFPFQESNKYLLVFTSLLPK